MAGRLKFVVCALTVLSFFDAGLLAQLDVKQALHLKDSVFGKYQATDLIANLEVYEPIGNYYQVAFVERDENDVTLQNISLLQAKTYANKDKTTTLAITTFYADMQCSYYETMFYEISRSASEIMKVEHAAALPSYNWEAFLSGDQSKQLLEKYLPQIRSTYLGEQALLDDVLREVYTPHFNFNAESNSVTVTLVLCDYIPVNHVEIDPADWDVIQKDTKHILLTYSKKKKCFVLTD